ncbi:hypothetical protein J4426_02645 [Candidatus Woesearchaeota archaeon]|nr:hypothetical protein [Candidatus Woesearchaeota archaeon]
MADNNETGIDKAKVERTIDRFIQNDGEKIYVEAPSISAITAILYGREMDKQYGKPIILPSAISDALISKPSTIMTALPLREMTRIRFRTEYQLDKISLEGQLIISLPITWEGARQFEKHPEEAGMGGLRKLFSPRFWFQTPQEYLDKEFSESLQRAYEWLQEERPLEQCDLKNRYAIVGLYLLNRYNEAPTTTQKAPLDEVVAKQVRRVPSEIIEELGSRGKKRKIKLVNGQTIVDMDCTLNELYGEQLQQVV